MPDRVPRPKPARKLATPALLVAALVFAAACGDSAPSPRRFAVDAIEVLPPATTERWQASPERLLGVPPEAGPLRTLLAPEGASAFSETHAAGGWSPTPAPDPHAGLWNHGPESLIEFHLADRRTQELSFRASSFSYPGAPPQRLAISVNAAALGEIGLSTQAETHRVRLPGASLRSGANFLRFRYGHVARPVDVLDGNPDARPLAVHFRSIALRAAPAAVPVVLEIDGSRRAALRHQQPGSLAHLVAIPPAGVLETRVLASGRTGSTARARIELEDDDGTRELWAGSLSAGADPEPVRVDLGAFAGRAARLRFIADALPSGVDLFWLDPRLLTKSDARTGDAGPVAPRANLVVVVLDAAARNRFGAYGAADTTPNIDRIASESLVFDDAHAQAAYTLASTASLLTSLHPARHGVVVKQKRLGTVPTLAEALQDAGYATAGFTANGFASPEFGFEPGFEIFEHLRGEGGWGSVALADSLADRFAAWLEERRTDAGGNDSPFFAYLHFIQPHEPFDIAPPRFYGKGHDAYEGELDGSADSMLRIRRGQLVPTPEDAAHLEHLYRGMLRYSDHVVGRLFEDLEERGLLEETIVVVTSDHGEALGEEGYFGHNWTVQEEVMAIPLLLRFPSKAGLRGRVALPAASIDIAPTLLAAAGIEAPASFEGRNLVDEFRAKPPRPRVVLSRTAHEPPWIALWFEDWKLVYDGRAIQPLRLMRRAGPGPRSRYEELPIDAHPVTAALLSQAREALQQPLPEGGATARGELSAETRRGLEALGYVLE